MQIAHLDTQNNPKIVDITDKQATQRSAIASGIISMNEEAYKAVLEDNTKKGSVIHTAIIAAISGAKKTSDIIPMCHNITLSSIECDISPNNKLSFKLSVKIKCNGKTGVEMEALSAVSIGLLCMYDMLKALDKSMIIGDICLMQKSGGKSKDYAR